jgi:hypothetical protein
MAKEKQPFEALSETAEKAVQNMEKARGAMDNYFSFLQNIWGSNDLTGKNENLYRAKHFRFRRLYAQA